MFLCSAKRVGKATPEQRRAWARRNPDKVSASQRKWADKHRPELRKYSAQYRITHPDPRTPEDRRKYRHAHDIVRKALLVGRLIKPDLCDRCFAFLPLDAHHHNGYELPLDVVWLCRRCHRQAHGRRS